MTVTTLFRRTTLATSLLLALAGCSVMTPYKVPSSALEAPLEQNSGWHLASSTEREAAANQAQAGQTGAAGQKSGTADKAAPRARISAQRERRPVARGGMPARRRAWPGTVNSPMTALPSSA